MYIYKFKVAGYPVILSEYAFSILVDFSLWRIRTWRDYFTKIEHSIEPYYEPAMGRREDVASELMRLYYEGEYEIERIITKYRTSAVMTYQSSKEHRRYIEYRVWIHHDYPAEYDERDCDDMLYELLEMIPPSRSVPFDIGYEISHAIERSEVMPYDAEMNKWYAYVAYETKAYDHIRWWLLERNGAFRIREEGTGYTTEIRRWKWW